MALFALPKRLPACLFGLLAIIAGCGDDHQQSTATDAIGLGVIEAAVLRIPVSDYRDAYAWYGPPNFSLCTCDYYGNCTLCVCPYSVSNHGVSAGLITVAAGGWSVQLEFGDQGYTNLADPPQTPWVSGETVSFTAAGSNAVPAHQGTESAPSFPTVYGPDLTQELTIDRTRDLPLSWQAPDADEVTFDLSSGSSGAVAGDSITVRCTYAASIGVGALPAVAMAGLLPNGADRWAHLTVSAGNVSSVKFGDWSIGFRAQAGIQADVTVQ
jgi:hypothetical protein